MKAVNKGETTQFTAVLTKTPSLEIKINIKDSTMDYQLKEQVKLTSIENSEDYQTIITGATGQVTLMRVKEKHLLFQWITQNI